MNKLSDSKFFTLPLGRIVAVGVGHSGKSIMKHMIEEQNTHIELIIANINEQNDYEKLSQKLNGADIVFIIAGFNGKEGIETALNIVKTAKEIDAFTIGIVFKPFYFEGDNRLKITYECFEKLQSECDSVVVISNNDIPNIGTNALLNECFKTINTRFSQVISGISGVILSSGKNDINLDIDDLKTVMCHQGVVTVGIGEHQGENAAVEAINHAIRFAMLDDISLKNASGVLIHFNSHPEFDLMELSTAMEIINNSTDESADIIFGTTTDESLLLDFIRVTIIVTGIEKNQSEIFSILAINEINGKICSPPSYL